MRKIGKWQRGAAAAMGAASWAAAAWAEDVTLAVASNFIPALAVLQPMIEEQTGATLVVVNGSTGKLYAQIEQGAPFDLFLAADEAHIVKYLETHPDASVAPYAIGQLAQVSREDVPQLKEARIAIADPALAPYGVAGHLALVRAGFDIEKLDLVFGPNVGAVAGFLATGNVDVAFVAASQIAQLTEFDAEIVDGLAIPQSMVLLSDKQSAHAVFDALQSEMVRAALPDLGYLAPVDGQ